jgi:glycosyltransferase involved in cell wall biosynthesis
MTTPALTYLVTTYNKLPFLRCALDHLLTSVRPDEDVIIVDGASSDGTPAYLAEVAARHAFVRFVSERDHGEAHGWNKGLIAARGALIKLVSDDDVFDYGAIATCRSFMEQTPAVDVLWTNGAGLRVTGDGTPVMADDAPAFDAWKAGRGLLFCCGLGLMIRKASLPLVGLFNTSTRRIDGEFSLRLSAGKARLAWYSGAVFARMENPQSVAVRMQRRMALEETAFKLAYHMLAGRAPSPTILRAATSSLIGLRRRRPSPPVPAPADERIAHLFAATKTWLAVENQRAPGSFHQ